jgi:hypothetical protein
MLKPEINWSNFKETILTIDIIWYRIFALSTGVDMRDF